MLTGQRDEKDCFEYSRSREDRKFTHLTSWTPCVRHHLFIIISFIIFLLSNLFLRIVELWVSVGHVPVRVELKALNVEVRKSLVEIIKSRQWRV